MNLEQARRREQAIEALKMEKERPDQQFISLIDFLNGTGNFKGTMPGNQPSALSDFLKGTPSGVAVGRGRRRAKRRLPVRDQILESPSSSSATRTTQPVGKGTGVTPLPQTVSDMRSIQPVGRGRGKITELSAPINDYILGEPNSASRRSTQPVYKNNIKGKGGV